MRPTTKLLEVIRCEVTGKEYNLGNGLENGCLQCGDKGDLIPAATHGVFACKACGKQYNVVINSARNSGKSLAYEERYSRQQFMFT